ncbi:autotransporter domain-containing protein, partial [Acetobacter malorum]|uniref:autotransporter domain-containing protein n=2 Tax=Acetobacter malorum TaxID=178901 RepID=UPI0022310944
GTETLSGAQAGQAALGVEAGAALDISGAVSARTLAGSGDVTLQDGSALTLKGDGSFAGGIAGAGALAIEGQQTLTGENTFTGGTDIASGAGLTVADTATHAAGLAGAVTDDGSLILDNTTDPTHSTTLAGDITGAGAVIAKDGALTLAGANSFSGGLHGENAVLTATTASLGTGGVALDGGSLTLAQDTDGTTADAITGTGSLIKTGRGTLTLSAASSFMGGTAIQSGTVAITDGAALGTGAVRNDAALTLALAGDGTVANAISGKGHVSKSGEGRVKLAGAGTWTGGAAIDAGTLAGGVNAFGTGAIVDNAALEVDADRDGTFANSVSGTGNVAYDLAKDADVTVTGHNGYAGGTDIETGTVTGGAGAFGSGSITDNGHLVVDQASDATMGNAIGGTGSLTKEGAGNLTLTGHNDYAGGTDIEHGTLTAGTDSLGTGAITDNASLVLKQDYNGTVAGAISGSGSVTKLGTGDVTLQDVNTYTGGTNVLTGTLTGTISSFGTGAISVAKGAVLDIDQKTDPEMANAISGAGAVVKTNTGTVVMTGTDTHTGGTVVTAGTLVTTAANLAGGQVVNNATLIVKQDSGTANLNTSLSGSGSLVKQGAGVLNVTGDTSGLTGATDVQDGTLNIESDTTSDITTRSGSILSGQGSVGNTVIETGSTLAPAGDGIGTLHVAGNLVMNQGASLKSNTDGAHTDLVDVAGSAKVTGAAEVLSSTGNVSLRYGQSLTILHADGGVTGRFGGFTTNIASLYPFLTPGLVYDADDVMVSLVRNQAVAFGAYAISRNQQTVASALDGASLSNPIVTAVEQQGGEQSRRSYDSLSGEIRASVKTNLIQDTQLVRSAVFDRLASAECGMAAGGLSTAGLKSGEKTAGGHCESGPVLWGEAFGDHGHNDSNGTAGSMKRTSAGFIMGLDSLVTDTNIRVGGLVSYGHDRFSIGDGRASSGRADNLTIGGYAGTHWKRLMVRGGATYAWNMLNMTRSVVAGGFHDHETGRALGGTAQGFGELAYHLGDDRNSFEPFGQVAYVNQSLGGSHEHGGAAALRTRGSDTGVTFATFGMRGSKSFAVKPGFDLSVFGSAAYRHAFGSLTPTAHQVFAGAGSMDVAGTPLAGDAAVLQAGVSYKVGKNVDVGLSYTGQFGTSYEDNAIQAHAKVNF